MVRAHIEIIGLKSVDSALKLLATDLTKHQANQMYNLLTDARDEMIEEITPWSFTGELIESFRLVKTKNGDTYNINLKNISPYAGQLERGSSPRFIRVDNNPKIQQWLQNKGLDTRNKDGEIRAHKGSKWLPIGGAGDSSTFIKFGNSERQFFGPVINRKFNSGDFDEFKNRGLATSLKEFERRAKGRDKTIIKN